METLLHIIGRSSTPTPTEKLIWFYSEKYDMITLKHDTRNSLLNFCLTFRPSTTHDPAYCTSMTVGPSYLIRSPPSTHVHSLV